MSRRRTPEERVKEAEARLRLEEIALRRKAVKARAAALATYSAAGKDRRYRDWNAKARSADAAIIPDAPTLIARARQMVRDDCHAASIKRAFVRNVIGRGIIPMPSTQTVGGSRDFDTAAERMFWDWASDPRKCDIERRRDLWQIQRWVVGEMVEAGDALVVLSQVYDAPGRTRLVLQLIEAEQLDRYRTTYADESGEREVRGGVEVDEYGAAVAYWIYTDHPNDYIGYGRIGTRLGSDSIRIPADRVCHVFDPDRARQTRGASRLAPAMLRLRDLSTYDNAQLLAAKAEACIGLMITSDLANSDRIGLAQPADGEGGADRTDADGNDELAMQPLMVARLAPGEKVEPFTPTRPGTVYEPFTTRQLRSIAAGVGVSYEQVARDFTGGTYSSQRQGMLEDQREYRPLQELVIAQLCRRVYEAWMDTEILNGRLAAPAYTREKSKWQYCMWMPDGWPWIDPEKEANAAEKALAMGLDTKQRLLAERGRNWQEVATQRAEEERYERSVSVSGATEADGLNGAQITAAVGILEKLGAGLLTPIAAEQLLIEVGMSRDDAARIVADTESKAFEIQRRQQQVGALPEPSTGGVQ